MTRVSKLLIASAALAAALLVRPAPAAAQFVDDVTETAVVVDSAGPGAPQLLQPMRLRDMATREYPALLRDAGVKGLVVVRVHVGDAGNVERATVISESHTAFGEPALRVARHARFRPVAEGGAAGDAVLRITFHPG